MIVSVQSRFLQTTRLLWWQHAPRAAYFHAHGIDTLDHLNDFVEVAVVTNFAPRSAHAETRAACLLRFTGFGKHLLNVKQTMHFDVRMIARSLRTVSAILRASTCLDR